MPASTITIPLFQQLFHCSNWAQMTEPPLWVINCDSKKHVWQTATETGSGLSPLLWISVLTQHKEWNSVFIRSTHQFCLQSTLMHVLDCGRKQK